VAALNSTGLTDVFVFDKGRTTVSAYHVGKQPDRAAWEARKSGGDMTWEGPPQVGQITFRADGTFDWPKSQKPWRWAAIDDDKVIALSSEGYTDVYVFNAERTKVWAYHVGKLPARPLWEARVAEAGFVPLFNNDDLTGWNALRSASIDWKNENGTITGRNRSGSPNSAGVLQSQKQYRDFHLRCEMLAGSGAEPALLFRSGGRLVRGERHGYALTNPVTTSPSIDEGWGYGSLYADDFQVPPHQCRLAPAAEKDLGVKTGDWLRLEIIAQGEVVEIRVNGKQTVRHTSSDLALNRAGSFSLRCHAGTTVAFRNVEIKELPASSAD
jgi:hypothetical protein